MSRPGKRRRGVIGGKAEGTKGKPEGTKSKAEGTKGEPDGPKAKPDGSKLRGDGSKAKARGSKVRDRAGTSGGSGVTGASAEIFLPPKRHSLDEVPPRALMARALFAIRRQKLLAASLAGLVILVGVYLGVYQWARMPEEEPLGPEARKEAMALLAMARDSGEPLPERPRSRALRRRVKGPLFVTLHHRGQVPFEHRSASPVVLWDALRLAAEEIRATEEVRALSEVERRASRFKVDIALGRAPMLTWPEMLQAISLVPGVDGLGVRVGKKTAYLDPDTLLRRGLVTGYQPFKFVAEFKAGLHIGEADELLGRELRMWEDGRYQKARRSYFRFRTDGFVEAPYPDVGQGGPEPAGGQVVAELAVGRGAPLPVYRGNTPGPAFNRQAVIQSCVDGGNYILRQLMQEEGAVSMRFAVKHGERPRLLTHPLMPGWVERARRVRLSQGQFKYIYYPVTDNYEAAGYSLPRHAGTTYALALLYGLLKGRPGVSDEQIARFKEGAERAIGYLATMVEKGTCKDQDRDFVCVASGPRTDLGSSALPLVAIMEYERQTGDARYRDLGRRLANFMLYMQKPDGEFCHQYDVVKARRSCKETMLYYSGEAAFALALTYKHIKDGRYMKAVERSLDYLTGASYWPLSLKFLFGEEHWTCIAAEEAWPHVNKASYARFCYEFARFQRRHQFAQDEGFADYEGGYGITPFFPPHLTPAGSRTEAMVSAYDLGRHRGEPQPAIGAQIVRAFKYILRHQVRPENAYMYARPRETLGGINKSPIKYEIRIDYVQHTVAAMVRALDLVPEASSARK